MIPIYLCDDEESVRHQLKTALEWKIFIENYDMKVVCAASTAQELLDMARSSRRGVYFLDVDLKEGVGRLYAGAGTAAAGPSWHTGLHYQLWRSGLENLPIPFGGIRLHCEGGEQTGPAITRCLEAVHARLLDERHDPAEMFSLRTGDETRHIPLDDILFFEAAPKAHHVYLHTADSRLDFVGSLNELEKDLDGRFVRVHRSFLAAWDKIEAVEEREIKSGWVAEGVCCPELEKPN